MEKLSSKGGEQFASLVAPSVELVHVADGPVVGRLGGAAMLDPGESWPEWDGRPLTLVAVLDLSQMPRMSHTPLPGEGWLNFFYDAEEQGAWGFDPKQSQAWRVIHASSRAQQVDGPMPLPPVSLSAVNTWTVPDMFEDALDEVRNREDEGLSACYEALGEAGIVHRIGGWPDLVQNPLWLEAQLASHGIYVGEPDGYRDPRVDNLRVGAADWRLLLQIDSDDDAEMMWGDVGRLYFLMNKDDLIAERFEKAWMVLQCC